MQVRAVSEAPPREKSTVYTRVRNSIRYHLYGPQPRPTLFEPYIGELTLAGLTARFEIHYRKTEPCIVRFAGEKEFLAEMLAATGPDDVFWDIGGFLGMVAVFAALKAKNGRVVTVEPDPSLGAQLRKNVDLNGVKNVELLPIALGEREEKLRLNTSGDQGAAPSFYDKGLGSYIEVPVRRIDDIVRERPELAPTVMKMDVEGFESHVLRGGLETLANPRLKAIFLEYHPVYFVRAKEQLAEPLNLLEQAGFVPTWCDVKGHEVVLTYKRRGT